MCMFSNITDLNKPSVASEIISNFFIYLVPILEDCRLLRGHLCIAAVSDKKIILIPLH